MRRNAMAAVLLLSLTLTACQAGQSETSQAAGDHSAPGDFQAFGEQTVDTSVLGTGLPTVEYSDRDLSGGYYDSVTEITLGDGDVVITEPGTYILSGTLADGQVRVEAGDAEKVQLVLNGTNITNRDGPAIYVRTADKVFLTLAAGTENILADGADYDVAGDENELDGCVFSQEDLTINGSGSLTVTGNYSHGIITKDDLTITGGTITVTAANEGLKGKDAVQICGGVITVNAADDAIAASNETDSEKGWMSIDGGDLTLTAGDDGLHAEGALVINGGTIRVLQCVEGLEGRSITINGGEITIDADDDGVNAAGGVGSTASSPMQASSVNYLHITGGTLNVTARGDGLDSNGVLVMDGGVVYVSQSGSGDSALDADGGLVVNGGTMVAAGDAQMAETFGESSTQYSFLYQFSGTCAAGTELTVTGENGTELVRFAPEQDYQCVVVSAPELTEGTYTVSAGDESGEIALSGVSSSNGSGMAGGFGGHGGGPGGDGGQFQPGGQRPDGGMELPEGMESMEPPGDMESMELPEGMEMPDDMEMPGGPGQGGRDFGGKEPDGGQTKG